MRNLIIIAFVLICYKSGAQAGIFKDANGESAIKLFGSSVSLSTKDESIDFAAGKYARIHEKDLFTRWAATLQLKANEGMSNLKDDNKFLIDGSAGFYFGLKKTSDASSEAVAKVWERFISGSIGVDRNKLFNTALQLKDMVYSKGQFVYKLEAGQFGYVDNFLYGVSISYKRQTNVEDIKTKAVSFLDFASAGNAVMVLRQKQAYDINDFIADQHVLSVNADGAWLINRDKATDAGGTAPSIFLGLHLRYQHLEDEHGQFNPAIGFYLGKHGAPKRIVGGFNIQFIDLLNAQDDEETNAWDRAAVNFVVGFKLSK